MKRKKKSDPLLAIGVADPFVLVEIFESADIASFEALGGTTMTMTRGEPMLAEKDLCPENLKESLRAYAEGRPTGSFLRAVLENDLGMAVLRGDEENKKLLPEIYAFVVDVVPSFARGSKAAVESHLQKAEEDRAEYASSHGQQNDENYTQGDEDYAQGDEDED